MAVKSMSRGGNTIMYDIDPEEIVPDLPLGNAVHGAVINAKHEIVGFLMGVSDQDSVPYEIEGATFYSHLIRPFKLGLGKSFYLELPGDIKSLDLYRELERMNDPPKRGR